MKKILMLAVMLIASISAFSQSYRGDMVMSNKVDTHDSISTFSLKKGSRLFVSAELMFGEMPGVRFSATYGAQLNNKFFLGGGTGYCIAVDWYSDHYSIPVFADLRVDFLEKKISPFMELRAGVDIAIEGASGFYGNFLFGCRLKRFSLSAGVESMKGQDYDFPYYYVGRRERVYYGNFDESADPFSFRAFNFVTRCSFEF